MRTHPAIALMSLAFFAGCGGGSDTHTLSVTASGPGGVSSSPAGIGCQSATCNGAFNVGQSVTLTAKPSAGASFGGWTGACSGSSSTCVVAMSADKQVGASFVGAGAGTHTVTVTAAGSGAVTSSPPGISCPTQCTASFTANTAVTLTAVTQGGSTFSGWTGDCTGAATCALALAGDQTVTATFTTPPNSHRITVNVSGHGSVKSTPAGIDCPTGACASFFADGSSLTLGATPDSGQTFNGWSGGGCSGTQDCTITIGADATTTATFAAVPGY